jgi:ABC-type Fe3+/spermidine/putrescine transport system ATPase subunit
VSSSDPLLSVDRLSAAWEGVPVLRDVSFDLASGEFLSLLGPNGSGKTTLLRCIAGLESPTAGSVRLRGELLGDRPTHRRGIGLMSQEPALFPNRTVLENVAYAPLLARRPEPAVRAEVGRLLDLLRLRGFEARRPDQLSGGERQRVALARTLAARPAVVLLDEPFASIDLELRAELRTEFRRVLRELGTAALHVTHDRDEGLFLGDRVGLLFDGRLEAIGPPRTVFAHPSSARAARLLGYNVLASGSGAVAVDPTEVRLGPTSGGGAGATVLAAGTTGRETVVSLLLDDGQRIEARRPRAEAEPRAGDRVGVAWGATVRLDDPGPSEDRPGGASKEPKKPGGLVRP